jgi:hypothetical protein
MKLPITEAWFWGTYSFIAFAKRKNYAGSEKQLPTLIKEKEPLWYWVP